ncbi:FAD-dependent oxidoreductase domain-containing protein 2-like [Mizuhopecten yessoensis]|uniref:FAD-dependent oxidoreductase domain-containing protein 2 n=1 Tax=Mizuhopecten yessoensis TaxID=6573 RepID=A0A210R4C7_MIZYE|nr:FAD-dependent oxidoreductase domain-containing protein 2-like [Mizuhopecten yessoensis]OWF55933.1 FAD-dependent oxidoreductase domain-containing protein 2 [Mizuhopecten yessoensis]
MLSHLLHQYLTVFGAVLTLVTVVTTSTYHDYCILGAGPGGLQMAYFMEQSSRDYIVFERENTTGSFYTVYPRHRKLISINKRHTGKSNKEFNLRHDWNSLISHDESLLFKHYSKEMFPHADALVQYLQDYHKKLGLNVQFNSNMQNIRRVANDSSAGGHIYTMEDDKGNPYTCSKVIVATGIAEPNIPKEVPGMEYADGYESVSINPDDFEGQSVLILGRGNAAFEVADSIYGSTNVIHMVGRSRVRLAWATHYVGDLRAVNNGLLDTYQLKSLDGVLEAGLDEVKLVKQGSKFVLQFKDEEEDSMFPLDNFALREPYDRIVRCLGFAFDSSIFNETSKMILGKGRTKKFPKIDYDYQSTNNPGMYVVGVASHSLDFRKSAGGFIHGYRYTARALHHLMEWRYHQVPWPSTTGPITQLLTHIIKRINEASGTYQMFGILGDIIILKDNGREYTYLEEYPINLIHRLEEDAGHPTTRIIAVVLQYGANFSGPGNDIFRVDRATGEPSEAHTSNFLHPVLYYYETLPTKSQMLRIAKDEILPRPKLMHHIVEDFLTVWDGPLSHILPLRRYIENVLSSDMRNFFSEDCLEMALTQKTVPIFCEDYLGGEGIPGYRALQS